MLHTYIPVHVLVTDVFGLQMWYVVPAVIDVAQASLCQARIQGRGKSVQPSEDKIEDATGERE